MAASTPPNVSNRCLYDVFVKDIFSTHSWPLRSRWIEEVDSFAAENASRLDILRRLLAAARTYPVLVLNGSLSGYADPVAAAVIARRRRPPHIVLTDCTWKAGAGRERLVRRRAVRAIDGAHLTYCVLSSFERARFPDTWSVAHERVTFTPFYVGLHAAEIAQPPDADEGFVFAGGDSMRDYAPLLAAASRLGAPLRIASRTLNPAAVPEGVHAGEVSPSEYTALTRRAATVVVPLENRVDRSAGQLTYLNAMALGKPVVVTDAPGVRDYIIPDRTGLIVPLGDSEALARAVAWTTAPATRAMALEMGRRARQDVLKRFMPEAYVDRLLEVVERVRAGLSP